MNELVAYLTVLIAAAIPWLEVLLVVPAGIVAGLPPIPTALVGAGGNIATLVPLVVGGDRLRAWWRDRSADRSAAAADDDPSGDPAEPDPAGQDEIGHGGADAPRRRGRGERARRVFDRFGLPGLALIGPLVTGIHVAAIVGLAAGADRRRAVWWLSGGVVVWSFLAAGATVVGIDTLIDPDDLPDLFALD